MASPAVRSISMKIRDFPAASARREADIAWEAASAREEGIGAAVGGGEDGDGVGVDEGSEERRGHGF